MRDHDEGARPGVEQIFHGHEHVGVEVVGGLIEDEHVGLVEQNQHELQAATLATREVLDRRRQLRTREAESLQQLPGRHLFAFGLVGRLLAAHHLAHAVIGHVIEFEELLRQHGHLDRLAAFYPSRGRRQRAGHQRKQCRLTGAVHAQDSRALPRRQTPRHVGQNRVLVEHDPDVFEVHHVFTEALHGHAGQRHRVARLGLVGNEVVCRIDTKLGLSRPRGCTAAQPGQLLAHQVSTFALDGGVLPITLEPLQNIGRVSALERLHNAIVHLPRGVAHLVEKPAIVCHHEQRTRTRRPPRLEVTGQPGDALHVQVVRGLIEKEHVVVAHEQLRQRHTAALATRQRPNGGIPADIVDQAGQHVANLRVRCPLVIGRVAHNRVGDSLGIVEAVALREHANREVAPSRDLPSVGFELTREDVEQR